MKLTFFYRFSILVAAIKDASVVPITLYFRHLPNAALKIALGAGSGGLTGKIEDWFSK